SKNAAFTAERFIERLPQNNPHILHCVMLVHIEIAARLQSQIEAAVMREQFQHVIKEPDAGRHLVASSPFNRERDLNLRLFADPLDASFSHRCHAPCAMPSSSSVSWSAVSNRSACARGPSVMRTHPSQP